MFAAAAAPLVAASAAAAAAAAVSLAACFPPPATPCNFIGERDGVRSCFLDGRECFAPDSAELILTGEGSRCAVGVPRDIRTGDGACLSRMTLGVRIPIPIAATLFTVTARDEGGTSGMSANGAREGVSGGARLRVDEGGEGGEGGKATGEGGTLVDGNAVAVVVDTARPNLGEDGFTPADPFAFPTVLGPSATSARLGTALGFNATASSRALVPLGVSFASLTAGPFLFPPPSLVPFGRANSLVGLACQLDVVAISLKSRNSLAPNVTLGEVGGTETSSLIENVDRYRHHSKRGGQGRPVRELTNVSPVVEARITIEIILKISQKIISTTQ